MAKKFAMWFGWLLAVLGVLGFFSNPIIGSSGSAWFMADTASNVVHLISGVVLLWAVYGAAHQAAKALKILGIVYLLIAIVGFFGSGSILGLFMVNGADNWLHLALAALFFWGSLSRSQHMAVA